jgi:hypothetical protein
MEWVLRMYSTKNDLPTRTVARGRTALNSVHISHASLFEFAFQQSHGQPRPIDDGNVELLQVKGNAADMVFVAMGDNHAFDFVPIFP